MKRRQFLAGAAITGIAGALALKPEDEGQAYSQYFADLNRSLRTDGEGTPALVLDLDILDQNIEQLKSLLPKNKDYRIVAKSLPSIALLDYVMSKSNTNKLMVFHQPFLNQVADKIPNADVLLGKPMPIQAARTFYKKLPTHSAFKTQTQLQWLIDSKQRLMQYQTLAHELEVPMNINIEIDVGLHRGGLSSAEELPELLDIIEHDELLTFSGFMGYDPHIVKIPAFIKSEQEAYEQSQAIYRSFVVKVSQEYPSIKLSNLTLNGAGSPSLALHNENSVANELSAGSCLVKPTDFDIQSLNQFQCAAFIATPVIKKIDGTRVPAIESLSGLMQWIDPNISQSYFIYGGHWRAKLQSPKGLQDNQIYGFSTNQHLINGSDSTELKVDDYVFLRPTQSEFVFLQFGGIQAFREGESFQQWQVL